MALLLLSSLDVVRWVAVGIPPRVTDPSPLSMVDWMVVIGLLDLSIYASVRLITWLEVKIGSLKLMHEVYRELGVRRDRRIGGDWGS
ncbi:MAG TPA: hypothetical protein VGJ99_07530 [Actinomycetota bacterium]|jgi:hypothetical protein